MCYDSMPSSSMDVEARRPADFFALAADMRKRRTDQLLTDSECYDLLAPLLVKAYTLWKEDGSSMDEWFHLSVDVEQRNQWIQVWESQGGMCTGVDFACDCSTESGSHHSHLIAWKGTEMRLKTFERVFARRFTSLVNPYMTRAERRAVTGATRKYTLKPITSAGHFIHVLLYISTEETKGFHHGVLSRCQHWNHTFVSFPTTKKMHLWRNELFLPQHVSIKECLIREYQLLVDRKVATSAGVRRSVAGASGLPRIHDDVVTAMLSEYNVDDDDEDTVSSEE